MFSNEHLTRQLDLIPLDVLGEPITVIGVGAIGSLTVLALAKMGLSNITVYDDDVVSIENMNSQLYPISALARPKVYALFDLVKQFTEVEIKTVCARYNGERSFSGIVISAVDAMHVRRQIWEVHRDHYAGTRAVIDPRMGAESALLYVMNPLDLKDDESYERTLYSDDEAVRERCTAKATIYTANMLAGLVCKAVKDLLTRPDYLRIANWNIANDAFEGFRRQA